MAALAHSRFSNALAGYRTDFSALIVFVADLRSGSGLSDYLSTGDQQCAASGRNTEVHSIDESLESV